MILAKLFSPFLCDKLTRNFSNLSSNSEDRRLIMNLEMQQTSVVRTENGDSQPGKI